MTSINPHCKKMKTNRMYRHKVNWFLLGQRRCHCCGTQLNWITGHKNSASVEHLVPKSKGGTLKDLNCLIVCHSCNQKRKSINWISWVTRNNFPKSEWLINKYIVALESYKTCPLYVGQNKVDKSLYDYLQLYLKSNTNG